MTEQELADAQHALAKESELVDKGIRTNIEERSRLERRWMVLHEREDRLLDFVRELRKVAGTLKHRASVLARANEASDQAKVVLDTLGRMLIGVSHE